MSVRGHQTSQLAPPLELPERHEITTTPAGIDVLYSPAPKRMYMLKKEGTTEDWTTVPSVTTILGLLDKSAPLIWWSQGIALEGFMELVKRGKVVYSPSAIWIKDEDGTTTAVTDKKQLVDLLVQEKLSTNHVRDKAGDRGVAVHDSLETWANTGLFPPLDLFPDEQRGYARGVWEFLQHVPSAVPVASEVMVGSVKHGFAGRYDLRFETQVEHEIVFKRTPVRGPQWATLKPGVYLIDLKTSAGVYASHAVQLAAYELASIECGYGPTEGRGILHVTAEGHYEFRRAKASADDFLAVVEVHRRFKNSKEWI